MTPFAELVVVELAGSVAGSYAGKLFADLGARVIIIEPPEGSPLRAEGEPLGTSSTAFAALNTGKQSLVLDLLTPSGASHLARLLARADIVIESAVPGPLQPVTASGDVGAAGAPSRRPQRGDEGAGAYPHLIKLYLSPFGVSGPYAGYRSTALTDYAMGGQLYLNGEPEREPVQGAGRQPEYAAAVYGFIGVLVALLARAETGRGQTVDVSHMETMASLHQWTTVRWTHGRYIQKRIGNRYDTTHPITVYPCKDGYVAISGSSEEQGQRFMAVSGLGAYLDDPRFATGVARLQNADAFDALLMPWLMAHTAAEIVEICQTARVPAGPVPGMLELLADAHLAARGFWQQPDGPGGLRYPGPPFRFSRHPWALRPAPALGADTTAILAQLSGIRHPASREGGAGHAPPHSQVGEPASSSPRLPLAGVRVLDLSRVWAGPIAARILGDFGADVIRVEAIAARGGLRVTEAVVQQSRRYPNNEAGERPWNREGMFNKFNRNKRAVTLQLNTPQGKAIFEDLVRHADIVLENYSPRVMPQLGLGYERLKELNPGIIYIALPGYGWSGPSRDWVAYGTTLEPAAGLSALMGYRDSGPYKSGVAWADPVAGLNAAAAMLVALYDRRASIDGAGQSIELAQLEAMITFIGEELLGAQVRGAERPRPGNRHPYYAPQGVYPCAGEDRWIAVSVTDEAAWAVLCAELGLGPEHAALRREERHTAHDALDAAIAAWTAGQEQMALMHRLQGRGIAAAAALDARQLVEDPHLAARGFFATITHPDAGTFPFPGQPAHLSETPATFRLPAPGLGEHNREVFSGLLAITDEQLEELRAARIIAGGPVGG